MADSSVEREGDENAYMGGVKKIPAAGKNEGMPGLDPRKHANIRSASNFLRVERAFFHHEERACENRRLPAKMTIYFS